MNEPQEFEDIVFEEVQGKTNDTFIFKFPKLIPTDLCFDCISLYDQLEDQGLSENSGFNTKEGPRVEIPADRDKNKEVFISSWRLTRLSNVPHASGIWSFVNQALFKYKEKYGVALSGLKLRGWDIKLQKVEQGGGYHVWHFEHAPTDNRVLAWMIYLNDIPDGEGETEFLYQGVRMKPEQGTLIMWPAGITHVHRGNPTYSQSKYCITGWIERVD